MEIILLFLSAVVAVTQQFHQQLRHDWSTSHFPQQRIDRNHPSINYEYLQNSAAFHHFVPTSFHSAHDKELYPSFMAIDLKNNQEFLDMQSRIKGWSGPSSLVNPVHGRRFFFNVANMNSNRFTKTATFTVTSSITLITVQSCVAAINVYDTGKITFCRRKRDSPDYQDYTEDFQYDIDPSDVDTVMPTVLPSLDFTLDGYTFSDDAVSSDIIVNDYTFDGDATSSNNLTQGSSIIAVPTSTQESAIIPNIVQDSTIDEVPTSTTSWWKKFRGKPFFDYSLTSTTVTSYAFFSTTVTKTVAVAGEAEVKCLPSDWIVCH